MKTHTTLRRPSFAFLVGLLTASLIVCGVRTVAALDVPLQVTEPAGVARTADPCRTGIPLVPGTLTEKNVAKLCVLDEKGNQVPAQFRVINNRVAGDAEWVSVAFLADTPTKAEVDKRKAAVTQAKAVAEARVKDTLADMGHAPDPNQDPAVQQAKAALEKAEQGEHHAAAAEAAAKIATKAAGEHLAESVKEMVKLTVDPI